MLRKNMVFILFGSLLISNLAGCGGNTANFDKSTSAGAQLVSISVTPPNPTIAVNTDQQCLATGMFSDNTTRDVTSDVTWISSDVDAVDVVSGTEAAGFTASPDLDISRSSTLSSPGHIKAKRPGQVRITAKWGTISGFTDVTVTPAVLVSISVTPTNPSIAQGTIQQFIATGTFSDGTTQNLTEGVDWSTSAGAVGSISNEAGSKGLASALAAGSTTVAASSGSISGSSTLTVTSAVLISIAVTPANPSIAVGSTQQFTATGTFSDNSTQNLTATVTWNRPSVDNDIASIYNEPSRKGLAAAWNAGSTTITAISGSISGTTTLTVTDDGSVTLTWDAPTTNTDGSSLNPVTDLTSYKIYYGTASQTYTQVMTIANPGTMTITQTLGLSAGTYYIAVTTVDSAGTESDYSNEVMKTI